MKKNQNHKKSFLKSSSLAVGTILALLLVFNQCVIQSTPANKKKTTSQTESNNSPTTTETPTPVPEPPIFEPPIPDDEDEDSEPDTPVNADAVNEALPKISIKNFEQIRATYVALSGVDPNDRTVRDAYSDVEMQLPENNDIKSFLANNQVAITKLASAFCDRLVENSSLRSQVWPGFNFGAAANQSFNSNGILSFIDRSIEHFYGAGTLDSTEQMAIRGEMQNLAFALLSGENLGSSGTTRKVAKGLCIANLSSLQVVTL